MVDNNELKALICLVDDPDETIYNQIRDKLISIGEPALTALELYWEKDAFGNLFQGRVEDLVHDIQFETVKQGLKTWKEEGATYAFDGALWVARYQYPELDFEATRIKINKIRNDIWIELNHNLTSFEKIRVFNKLFFEVYKFLPNKKNYHAPQNSYINDVLVSKRGNPLSLSLLYITIAQNLGLPLYGVNLPSHFVLCYLNENRLGKGKIDIDNVSKEDVLFYVNPFSGGAYLDKQEIVSFLKQIGSKPNDSYFLPCNNIEIVKRILANLIFSYKKLGYNEKQAELISLLEILV